MSEVDEPDYELLYQELLYEVCDRVPGETRHQTALRYIQFGERLARLSERGQTALREVMRQFEQFEQSEKRRSNDPAGQTD